MASVRITRIVGHGELAAARKAVRPQLEELLDGILDDSQFDAPVDSGDLKRSGSRNVHPNGTGTVGYDAEYAPFVSDGAGNVPANDFFTAAVYKPRRVTKP